MVVGIPNGVQIIPFPEVLKTGANGQRVYWRYVDISTGNVIPVGASGFTILFTSLHRPDGQTVDIANTDTAVGPTVNQAPTADASGAVTSVPNRWFYSINMGTQSPGSTATSANTTNCEGNWYVETTFTWEGITSTFRVCFQVSAIDSTGSRRVPTEFTPYIYCTPEDVGKEMMAPHHIDENHPAWATVVKYILETEGEWDAATRSSYRPNFIQDEEHDFQGLVERYEDFPDYNFLPHPIKLDYAPILPFDVSNRHRIEVYEGGGTGVTGDPIRRWTEWLNKRYDRSGDFWFDWVRGEVRVRKFLIRRAAAVRISYEVGKPITQTTEAVAADDTTIPVLSTFRYQNRGVFRIGDEYIYHTGADAIGALGGFFGCRRGLFGTTPRDHPAGAEVYEIPDDVRALVAGKVAAKVALSNSFAAIIPDGTQAPDFKYRIELWNRNWAEVVGGRNQQWGVAG